MNLSNISQSDRDNHAALISLAEKMAPHSGAMIILDNADMVQLLGVAEDLNDLYYVVRKRDGEVIRAPARNRITALKDRVSEEEYEALYPQGRDHHPPLQVIVDQALDPRWLAGAPDSRDATTDDVLEVTFRALRMIISDAPNRRETARKDLARSILARPESLDQMLSIDIFDAMALLDEEYEASEKTRHRHFEFLRRGALNIAEPRHRDLLDHAMMIGGVSTGSALEAMLDLSSRLWPDYLPPIMSKLDSEVLAHLQDSCRWAALFLRIWMRQNRWVIDRIAEHRKENRLTALWVPLAYFCLTYRPAITVHRFPGYEPDLELIASDLGHSIYGD